MCDGRDRGQYHDATFRLLGRRPRVSAETSAAVRWAEERLGLPLPRSVREWYEYEEAVQILLEHSNQNPPIALEDFEIIRSRGAELLLIRHENQGVCTWAVLLDGSDDPPVHVDVDSEGMEWRLQAASFSAYVYSCVWDYRQVFGRPALVQAQNSKLSQTTLQRLLEEFDTEVITHGWPGDTQHRFVAEKAALLIWDSADQADWFISADDAMALEAVVAAVWDLDNVGGSLYECSEIGKAVLARLGEKKT